MLHVDEEARNVSYTAPGIDIEAVIKNVLSFSETIIASNCCYQFERWSI